MKYFSTSIYCICLIAMFSSFQLKYENDVKTYFQETNKANRNLYNGKLDLALEDYLNAFKTTNHHFFHDYQKAIVISHKLGQKNVKRQLLRKIAAETKIDSYSFLNKFKSSKVFNDEELDLIRTFRNKHDDKNQRFYQIYYELKRVRLARTEKSFRFETEEFLDTLSDDSYKLYRDSIDAKLANDLIQLIAVIGPPVEGNLGQTTFCSLNSDTDLSSVEMIRSMLRILWKTPSQQHIEKILTKALHNGDIHPSLYSLILQYPTNRRVDTHKRTIEHLNTTVIIIMDKYYIPFIKYSDSLMSEIDGRRNEIGLDSFKIAQRQVMCSKLCKDENQNTSILDIYTAAYFEQYGLGFVKYALKKENLDVDDQLSYHRINTAKISKECSCDNLKY